MLRDRRVPFLPGRADRLSLIVAGGVAGPLLIVTACVLPMLPHDGARLALAAAALAAGVVAYGVTLHLVREHFAPFTALDAALGAYLEDGITPADPIDVGGIAGSLAARFHRIITELEMARDEMRQKAVTDPLTGLGNRRWLDAEAERAFALMRRSGAPLSAVTFDIDHFKSFNDRYGHAAGDEVLRMVAASVRGQLRSYDLFARIGGGAFCILLPNTSLALAQGIAERLRTHMHNLRRDSEGASDVTASFGVASSASTIAAASQLMAQADRALSQARIGGCDRVHAAERQVEINASVPAPIAA